MLIDTHIHIWDFSKAAYPWLSGNTTILNTSFSLKELEKERKIVGITQGILVQAANNEQDTDWMLQVACQNDWINGVVGWLPLSDPDKLEGKIIDRKKKSYFKGARHLIHNELDPYWLLQPQVLQSLEILSAHQLTYDVVGILPEHLQAAIQVADKIPGLKIMLDHLNQPPHPSQKKEWQKWKELMTEASEQPNIHAKISGLGTAINKKNWLADDCILAIDWVISHFGTERCCLGGDWPVSLLAGSYVYTWEQYKQALTTLNHGKSVENIFFTTAETFYNL